MRITDDNLHGRVVLTSDGLAIGDVNRLFFHGGQFAIDAVEVKLRREISERLGFRHSTFHPAVIEIPAGFVQSVGDAVLLSAKLDDLRAMHPSKGVVDRDRKDTIKVDNVHVTPVPR
jgi:sporulation protein YlmC with PRC-barrel domain